MSRLLRATLALMLLALLVPAAALAARDTAEPAPGAARILDTPEPTPRRTREPRRTQAPDETQEPPVTPAPTLSPTVLPPVRNAITVGYRETGILGQAPLLVALLAGYFAEAGFEDVRIVEVPDTLADIRAGELDFAVVEARAAGAAAAEDPTLRAIAGFRNGLPDAEDEADLLLAAPGLVADEPATVIAFLVAYIRALQDLSDEDGALEALALIEATDLSLDPELEAGWTEAVGGFAPFDGGFGALEDEGGLGPLMRSLEDGGALPPDLAFFIAQHTLNIAQLALDLPPNPANPLLGGPGLTEVSLGLSGGEAAGGPLVAAAADGSFEAAGFEDVVVMDIEEPLLGVLTGELDFGVVPALEAADGVSQGLPLKVLAGQRNYAPDGTYGGDVLVVSTDLLEQEPATVGAFLIAAVKAAWDLRDAPDAQAWAPHDSGYGDRALDGGLGELQAHLTAALGEAPDPQALLAAAPLELAQAWWGLPANPIRSRIDASDASPDDAEATDAEAVDPAVDEEAG